MFKLTTTAWRKLLHQMLETGNDPVIPMITWGSAGSSDEQGWFFAGYIEQHDHKLTTLRDGAESSFFCVVGGIEFVVDGPLDRTNDLDGLILDIRDEELQLVRK